MSAKTEDRQAILQAVLQPQNVYVHLLSQDECVKLTGAQWPVTAVPIRLPMPRASAITFGQGPLAICVNFRMSFKATTRYAIATPITLDRNASTVCVGPLDWSTRPQAPVSAVVLRSSIRKPTIARSDAVLMALLRPLNSPVCVRLATSLMFWTLLILLAAFPTV